MCDKSLSQSQPGGNHVVQLFGNLSPIPEDSAVDICRGSKDPSHQNQHELILARGDTYHHANTTATPSQQASDKDLHAATAPEQSKNDNIKEEENHLCSSWCVTFSSIPLPLTLIVCILTGGGACMRI
jgi:hypothetical protein